MKTFVTLATRKRCSTVSGSPVAMLARPAAASSRKPGPEATATAPGNPLRTTASRRLRIGFAGTDEQRALLRGPNFGVATTLRPDGSPHSTVVWVDVDTDVVMFNTAVGRAKERHLREDPRVSVIVVDPEDAYKWVAVSGTAELTTDGADDQIDKLAKKYLGQDEYPWRKPEEERITVKIRPEKVETTGL